MGNTLAYYGTAKITAVKSFIVQAPGHRLCFDLKAQITSVRFNLHGPQGSNTLAYQFHKPVTSFITSTPVAILPVRCVIRCQLHETFTCVTYNCGKISYLKRQQGSMDITLLWSVPKWNSIISSISLLRSMTNQTSNLLSIYVESRHVKHTGE